MKIVFVITSSGDAYYCGNCFRDNLMAQAMKQAGHEVVIMPVYLPLRQKTFQADTPLFFPATTYYVAQKFFKHSSIPKWLQKLLGIKPLLNLAMSMAGTTTSDGMEDMTLSMISGERRPFTDMVQPMVDWILQTEKPDVVYVSSSMLLGIAKALKHANPAQKIACMAQDEEVWIDGLRKDDAAKAWQLMAVNLQYADVVITTSHYYKEKMKLLMPLPESLSVHVVYPGVDTAHYASESHPSKPTIGFFYRMNKLDGLDVLAEAFIILKKRNTVPGLRLRVGGGYTSADKKFVKKVKRLLAPYQADVRMDQTYDWDHHSSFFRDISVICVPLQFTESVGLYLLEAFAAGVPAVEPDLGSFKEIVDKAGLIYSKNDAISLANTLEQMFITPGLWEQCSQNALDLANRCYNHEVVAAHLEEIFKSLIK